jgi:hypothetical protein
MARPSLKANVVKKQEEEKAVAIARALSSPAPSAGADQDVDHETVSYHLPVDLIELVRELAEARVKIARDEKRKAKRKGERGPEARRSASAVVREALDAYRGQIASEIRMLKG